MTAHYLLQLILSGESDTLDFKKTISSAAKIAKTISAFANHRGGRLLIGVTDAGRISGVKSEDEKYMLDLAAQFYCRPPLDLKIIEWESGDRIVLEAIIPQGPDRPYYAKDEHGKWWAYIRVKDKSLLASKIVLDVIKRGASGSNTIVQFTRHETSLLTHLKKNERITLKEVCRLLNISRWRAQKMVVNLVSIGLLRSHTTEKTEFFTLS